MRRLLPLLLTLLVVGAFAWTLLFLYQKSQAKPVVFETVMPERGDILQKAVATGALVPRREVAIKPRVSGIVHKLLVQPGQSIEDGDLIAEIQIIPNVVNLNTAEARLASAQLNSANAKAEYERVKGLFDLQLAAATEANRLQLQMQLAQQELIAAHNNLQLIKEGAIRGSGKVSNQVRSTVTGTIIDVPVKEGASVIESNNFNEGTTIASVANMSDMVFLGRVDESEVGKLREGMPVGIRVGALDNQAFEGELEYISPKGVEKEGTIEFEVHAALQLKPEVFLRANYSASADIILDERRDVLTLSESALQFEDGKPYVEVEVAPERFEKRSLTLGLSDGLKSEVSAGLQVGDKVKLPLSAEEPRRGPAGSR